MQFSFNTSHATCKLCRPFFSVESDPFPYRITRKPYGALHRVMGYFGAMTPDLVLFHANCPDGFAAAWAIWKKYPSAVFVPVDHGQPLPVDPSGRNLLIVDFSYPKPVLEGIAKSAASIQVLDHHVTAQQALEGLSY